MDESNVNDNMGHLKNANDCAITWDDVVAIEDAARDLEEVPGPCVLTPILYKQGLQGPPF